MGRAAGPDDACLDGPEVRGSKLHLEEACSYVAREGEVGGELCGGGSTEVISRYVPGLPLPKMLAADLGVKVRVGPGNVV